MKTFFWKCKTGRGYTAELDMDIINNPTLEPEHSWNGELLTDWTQDAEEGDVWENASDYYICTKS